MRVLYREQFSPAPHVVWLVAATLVTASLADVAASALRARQRPDLVFRSYALAAMVAIGLGTWLTWSQGVAGSAGAMLAASVVAAGALWLSLPGSREGMSKATSLQRNPEWDQG